MKKKMSSYKKYISLFLISSIISFGDLVSLVHFELCFEKYFNNRN